MITFNRPVYAEAVFLIADKVNTNNRIYTTDAIELALGQYIKDYVNENRAVGYIDHSNQEINRRYIGIDMEKEYCEIAEARLKAVECEICDDKPLKNCVGQIMTCPKCKSKKLIKKIEKHEFFG